MPLVGTYILYGVSPNFSYYGVPSATLLLIVENHWQVSNVSYIQSNSVITNSSGPDIFVRYNRGSL
jgi:hypothetical protein